MFAASSANEGLFIFLVIVIVIGVGAFKAWMIIARPEVYKAQLEHERHRHEQRNGLLGPVLGGGFRLLGMFLGRRR